MPSLQNRIKRLEGFQVDDQLIVYVFRWAGGLQERARVTFGDDQYIERKEGEAEDAFLERATAEVKRLSDPNQKMITCFAW